MIATAPVTSWFELREIAFLIMRSKDLMVSIAKLGA